MLAPPCGMTRVSKQEAENFFQVLDAHGLVDIMSKSRPALPRRLLTAEPLLLRPHALQVCPNQTCLTVHGNIGCHWATRSGVWHSKTG